jgi:hypothetical protein
LTAFLSQLVQLARQPPRPAVRAHLFCRTAPGTHPEWNVHGPTHAMTTAVQPSVSLGVQRNTGRTARALNPVSRDDAQLFSAVMNGVDSLRGFTNADVRARLDKTPHLARSDTDQEAKCENQSHPPSPSRPRPHRQDPTLQTLANHPAWQALDGHRASTQAAKLPAAPRACALSSCTNAEKLQTKNLPLYPA